MMHGAQSRPSGRLTGILFDGENMFQCARDLAYGDSSLHTAVYGCLTTCQDPYECAKDWRAYAGSHS